MHCIYASRGVRSAEWQAVPHCDACGITKLPRPGTHVSIAYSICVCPPLAQDGRTETLGGSKKLSAVAGNVQELRLML